MRPRTDESQPFRLPAVWCRQRLALTADAGRSASAPFMNINLITAVLESPGKEKIRALLDDDTTVFWVDWREDEADIVRYCEAVLQTGSLTAEQVRAATPRGSELFISCNGKRVRAPLINGPEDRHIALCALNQVLAPDYEVPLQWQRHFGISASVVGEVGGVGTRLWRCCKSAVLSICGTPKFVHRPAAILI